MSVLATLKSARQKAEDPSYLSSSGAEFKGRGHRKKKKVRSYSSDSGNTESSGGTPPPQPVNVLPDPIYEETPIIYEVTNVGDNIEFSNIETETQTVPEGGKHNYYNIPTILFSSIGIILHLNYWILIFDSAVNLISLLVIWGFNTFPYEISIMIDFLFIVLFQLHITFCT